MSSLQRHNPYPKVGNLEIWLYSLRNSNKEILKMISILYFSPSCLFVEWTEFQGECQDVNSKTFETWKIDESLLGKIPLDKCKLLCQALEPCVACQCYDAFGSPDPTNSNCKVLTADNADPAVMNGLTLERFKSAVFTSNSYPSKGNIKGGWNRLYTCHVKPLSKIFNFN